MWFAAWFVLSAHAQQDACPLRGASSETPPTGTLFVQVIQIDSPDRDPLESAPDIYGAVKIGGTSYSLPEKPDTRQPTWNNEGRFEFPLPKGTSVVPIDITVWDRDPTSQDDEIYLGPVGRGQGRQNLHLDYDVCAGEVSGDNGAAVPAQNLRMIRGPGGDEGADIQLAIGSADGVPLVDDDVAIMSVDLVQVVPNPTALVADKPTVLAVTVGNSYDTPKDATLTVSVNGGGVNRTDTFTLKPINGNGSAPYYFYVDTPLRFTMPQQSVSVDVTLGAPGTVVVTGDCRAKNDQVSFDTQWKVVGMTELKVTWVRTGAYGDTMVGKPEYDRIYGLGNSYMLGTYPLPRINTYQDPGSFRPMLTSPVSFLIKLISLLQPLATYIDPAPAALIWELGNSAGLVGTDRVIGVLPDAYWFERYPFWSSYAGLSLSTNSKAVILLPVVRDNVKGGVGVKFTLPAHEVGHTFGLSVQPELRERFWCKELSHAVPLLGAFTGPDSMGCGIAGGMDEGNSDVEALKSGWPASGIWLTQGGEAQEIVDAKLLDTPQCDRQCLMGSTWPDQMADWAGQGRWIDRADFDRLFRRLAGQADPEVLFVSAIVGSNGDTFVGPWFHLPEGTPDVPPDEGIPAYSIRSYDATGNVLGEDVIRATYATPMEGGAWLPATFIQVDVPWRTGTSRIDLWDRTGEKALASKTVSANAPTVQIGDVRAHGHELSVQWTARDADRDPLQSWVETSTDGEHWWPAVGPIDGSKATLDPTGVRFVRVHVHDGVHTGLSEPRAVGH